MPYKDRQHQRAANAGAQRRRRARLKVEDAQRREQQKREALLRLQGWVPLRLLRPLRITLEDGQTVVDLESGALLWTRESWAHNWQRPGVAEPLTTGEIVRLPYGIILPGSREV